jgi:hypothetical protein
MMVLYMENWKGLFRPHILERGLNYYEIGAVENVQQTEKGFRATVGGSENYEVEIEIKDGKVNDMWCSCPYAEGGNYCKHMAAALYESEETIREIETGGKTWQEKFLESKQELEDVIGRIPEDELRSILTQLAQENESFRTRIMTKYSLAISEVQLIRLKKEIDNIVYHYCDRGGFIDWRNAGDFINSMENFLYDNVQEVINKGAYMQAFELTNDVFIKIGNQDMDDSDGGTTMAANTCYQFWKQILENCNESDKKEMFQWFEQHQADGTVIDFLEDYISDFLMNEFHDKGLLEQKLQMLDESITRVGDKTDCGSWWSAHYGYENNILKRLEIMRKLDYSEEEIQEYKRKNQRFSVIRKLEVEKCLEEGKITEAIRILNESKALDKEYPDLVAEYSAKLIDLYSMRKQHKEHKEELIFQVFSCRQDKLDYVNSLKRVCEQAEWEAHREAILKGKTGWQIKYPLLEEEGMYERLLKEIVAEGSIFSLDQYEKVLKKKFPEQVRDAYIAYIKKQADVVSDRKRYKELMKYLKKIITYPNGKEIATKVATEWRTCYYRRPAMMDELRKVGF